MRVGLNREVAGHADILATITEVGEDVRVGVGVGAVECQLIHTDRAVSVMLLMLSVAVHLTLHPAGFGSLQR